MKNTKQNGFTIVELIIALFILAILPLLGFINEWMVDTWLGWAGSTQDFPLWGGFLLVLLGPITITLALITFVVGFFL